MKQFPDLEAFCTLLGQMINVQNQQDSSDQKRSAREAHMLCQHKVCSRYVGSFKITSQTYDCSKLEYLNAKCNFVF